MKQYCLLVALYVVGMIMGAVLHANVTRPCYVLDEANGMATHIEWRYWWQECPDFMREGDEE